MARTRSQRTSAAATPASATSSIQSPPSSADSRKVMFSPSTASRVTAFVMKNNLDVFAIQQEVENLRERVRILDGNTGRNELLDTLKEREAESEKAQAQVRSLNDKFHEVHKGLVLIDEERQCLRKSKVQLEKEKKEVQRQLDMREKEVISLVKRCSAQEQKVKESSKIRASHSTLMNEMQDLRSTLSMRDDEVTQLQSVQRELQTCQKEREALIDSLTKLRKDHDSVAETLNSCFQTMQSLTESKGELEKERKRDLQRAELELEKQHLAHLEATNALRSEVQLRQERIDQMEGVLKDNMAITTGLRREKAEWHCKTDLELARLQEEHADERSTLIREQETSVNLLHKDYGKLISGLRSKLDEKDRQVSTLEGEVSSYMQKAMALSEDVQKIQDSSDCQITELAETIEELKRDRCKLEEVLVTKEKRVSEMSFLMRGMDADKSLLSTDIQKLQARIKELEAENAFIMDLEKQLFDVNVSSIEVEQQRYLETEEHQLTVELMQQELNDQQVMWATMESGLQRKIASLEAKLESTTSLETDLSRATETISSLELQATESSDQISELTTELGKRDSLIQAQTEKLTQFTHRFHQVEEEIVAKDKALAAQREELDVLRATAAARDSDLSQAREEVACLNRNNTKLTEEKARNETVAQAQLEETRSSTERALTAMQRNVATKTAELQTMQVEFQNLRISSEKDSRSIKANLEAKSAVISSLQSELSDLQHSSGERFVNLKMALDAKEATNLSLRSDLESLRVSSKAEIDQKSVQLSEREETVSALQTKTIELQQLVERNDVASKQSQEEQLRRIAILQDELEQARLSSRRELTARAARLTEKESIIVALREDIERMRNDYRRELLTLKASVDAKEESFISVKSELEHQQVNSDRENVALKDTISEMTHATKLLQHEVEELRLSKDHDANVNKKLVRSKDSLVSSLKSELEALRCRLEADTESSRQKISELKVELQALTTALSVKDDEIRELRHIELKDAEETIAFLEAEVARLQSSAGSVEKEATGALTTLQANISELAATNTALEQRLSEHERHHERTVEKANKEREALLETKALLEADLKEQSSKLTARHATISTLTRKNLLLEGRERSLRSDLEVALNERDHAKDEQEKALVALEREISRHQADSEEYDIRYQRKLAEIQKAMADTEAQLITQQGKVRQTEEILEERTRLLGDLVNHNKEADDEKEKAQGCITHLEQQIDLLEAQREATEDELSRVKAMLEKREAQFLETIEKERHLRELAEADLDSVTSRLSNQRRGGREVTELEKENNELRDKVRRQEVYLKRKLHKEKVLRERKSKNVLATPGGKGSPLKRRPPTANHNGPASVSLSETASFPDEWDVESL